MQKLFPLTLLAEQITDNLWYGILYASSYAGAKAVYIPLTLIQLLLHLSFAIVIATN